MKLVFFVALLFTSSLLTLAQDAGDVVYVVQVDDNARPQGPQGNDMPFFGRPMLDNHLSTVKSLVSSLFDGGEPAEGTFPPSPFMSKAFRFDARDRDAESPFGFRASPFPSRTFGSSSHLSSMVNSLLSRVMAQNNAQGYNADDRDEEADSTTVQVTVEPQPRAQPRERPCLQDARRLCSRSRMHPMAVLDCLRSFQPHLSPECESWLLSKGLVEPLPQEQPASDSPADPEDSDSALSESTDAQDPDPSQLDQVRDQSEEQPQEQPQEPQQEIRDAADAAVASAPASDSSALASLKLSSSKHTKPAASSNAAPSSSHFGAMLFGGLCGALVVFTVLGVLGYRRRIVRKKRTTSTVTEAHASSLSVPVLNLVEQRV